MMHTQAELQVLLFNWKVLFFALVHLIIVYITLLLYVFVFFIFSILADDLWHIMCRQDTQQIFLSSGHLYSQTSGIFCHYTSDDYIVVYDGVRRNHRNFIFAYFIILNKSFQIMQLSTIKVSNRSRISLFAHQWRGEGRACRCWAIF